MDEETNVQYFLIVEYFKIGYFTTAASVVFTYHLDVAGSL